MLKCDVWLSKAREYFLVCLAFDLVLSLLVATIAAFPLPLHTIGALLAGVVVGLVLSFFSQRVILKALDKKGELKSKYANLPIIFSVTLFLFMIILMLLGDRHLPVVITPAWVTFGVPIFVFIFLLAFLPAFFAEQIYLIRQWQRKNHKELLIQKGGLSSSIHSKPLAVS